jgi:phosphoglycolate phosphatase
VVALCKKHFGDLVQGGHRERPGLGRKPDPGSALLAMELLGAQREHTVYVGDSDVDVETARNAGLRCVAVSWGFRPRESLVAAGPDAVVDEISALLPAVLAL